MIDSFEQRWLSDLQTNWTEKRADFLCSQDRLTVDPKVYGDDLVAHYSIPHVQKTGGPLIEPASDIDSTKLLIDAPVLLVSKLNPRKKTICIAEPHAEHPTLASGEFVAINSDQMDRRYAYYLWCSEKVTDRLSAIVQSATRSHQRVNPADILKLPWKWPPPDTQRRIARFLDEKTSRIDGLIKKKRELLDRLAEKRQALITRAVTKGLNPDAPMKLSGIDWLGEIPNHWTVLHLRYAVKNLNNMRVPIAAELRKGIERTYPYYGASGIIDYVDEYIFDFPTVLVAEDGANLLSRSTPLSFVAKGKYWVNNHAHILRPDRMTIWFCSSLLSLYPLDPWISGSAQPKLTKENLGSLKVWVPPFDEQKQIEASVKEEADRLQKTHLPLKKSIEALEEYRSTLITAAVTGQLAELR